MKKYLAYLLRLWRGAETGTPVWHASLEDPHTRQVIQFSQLAELSAYLQALTDAELEPQARSDLAAAQQDANDNSSRITLPKISPKQESNHE